MAEFPAELFACRGVVSGLLVVEAGMLCLDGRQSQLNGLVKQVTEHLEPVGKKKSNYLKPADDIVPLNSGYNTVLFSK